MGRVLPNFQNIYGFLYVYLSVMNPGGPEVTCWEVMFPQCSAVQPAAVREAICLFGLKASHTGDRTPAAEYGCSPAAPCPENSSKCHTLRKTEGQYFILTGC